MSEETQRLLLASLGINERTARTLKMYFKGACQGRYKLTDDHEMAHTTLVDVDGLASPGEVSDYRNIFPGRPIVLLAKELPARPESLFLQKPLHMDTLVQTLEQLRQRLLGGAVKVEIPTACEPPPPVTDAERQMVRSARKYLLDKNIADTCGNQADVDLQDRRQREKMTFPFEETWLARFVAAWQLARSRGMPVQFTMLSKPIVVLPGVRKIVCALSERELRAVAVVRADAQSMPGLMQETEMQVLQKLMTSGKGLAHEPVEPLLWRLALWTSRGRVPQKTDFNVPLFMRQWPNFTRLLLTPSALQIAALWLHRPHSLATTAQVLGIPQRYVMSFYTATQVLDLSGTSRREADYLFAEPLPVEQHEYRSVFGRMIDRLSGNEKK